MTLNYHAQVQNFLKKLLSQQFKKWRPPKNKKIFKNFFFNFSVNPALDSSLSPKKTKKKFSLPP